MSYKLITAPAVEPITLTEAKAHLRWEITDEDALITSLIVAARKQCEYLTGRSLVTQTWELILDEFPAAEIKLGKPPVVSITSVKYIDIDGVEQTIADTEYTLDPDTPPGWLLPAYGAEWPSTRDSANAVRVRFVAGYGVAAAVPDDIKAWLKLAVSAMFANRDVVVSGVSIAELPRDFWQGLLDPYRLYGA